MIVKAIKEMQSFVLQLNRRVVFDATRGNNHSASMIYSIKALFHIAIISSATLVKSWFHSDLDPNVRHFAKQMLSDAQAKLEVEGLERIKLDQTYLFMSNHPSAFDIPVLIMAFSHRLRMIAKQQLMSIPVFGHAMHKAGFIPINRANAKEAVKQLDVAKKRLNEGVSIWIAPEGTRSPIDGIGPFKKGGFHLAIALGIEIVPVWIKGTREVIAPDEYTIHPNRSVQVIIGTPIKSSNKSVEELMEEVRSAILLLSGNT